MHAEPDHAGAALAAEVFPEKWAAATAMTGKAGGKRRATLRRQAKETVKVRELRAAGASCGSCVNRGTYPHKPVRMVCALDSDFHGYALTEATGLCSRWSA